MVGRAGAVAQFCSGASWHGWRVRHELPSSDAPPSSLPLPSTDQLPCFTPPPSTGALFWQWFNDGQEAGTTEGGGRGLYGAALRLGLCDALARLRQLKDISADLQACIQVMSSSRW